MTPKFRAWYKTKKIMSEVKKINFWSEELDAVAFAEKHFEDVELMQSTGLFDKNGKEIFEGDIVRFEDYYIETDLPYINKGIVEWSQGGFTITERASVEMEDLLDGEFLDLTIIGNIYENPELLEEE